MRRENGSRRAGTHFVQRLHPLGSQGAHTNWWTWLLARVSCAVVPTTAFGDHAILLTQCLLSHAGPLAIRSSPASWRRVATQVNQSASLHCVSPPPDDNWTWPDTDKNKWKAATSGLQVFHDYWREPLTSMNSPLIIYHWRAQELACLFQTRHRTTRLLSQSCAMRCTAASWASIRVLRTGWGSRVRWPAWNRYISMDKSSPTRTPPATAHQRIRCPGQAFFLNFMFARLISANQIVPISTGSTFYLSYHSKVYKRELASRVFLHISSTDISPYGDRQPLRRLFKVSIDDRHPRILDLVSNSLRRAEYNCRTPFPIHNCPPLPAFPPETTAIRDASCYPSPPFFATRILVHTTLAGDETYFPVFPVISQETVIFFLQTMGSIDPRAVVYFCILAFTLFAPTPEEERWYPSKH